MRKLTIGAATPQELEERTRILDALARWVRQRPGLEYGNYCSGWQDTAGRRAYFAEMRGIGRDLQDAETLLRAVRWREASIPLAQLKDAFSAFSGRLSWNGRELSYVAGQYLPTEYRAAVCAVLARALWYGAYYPGAEDGHAIRRAARAEFGRGIARRWFDWGSGR